MCGPLFVATNFTKLKIILFLNGYRKKFSHRQRITVHLPQKIVTHTKLSKICVGDPISDLGSGGQKGTRSATLAGAIKAMDVHGGKEAQSRAVDGLFYAIGRRSAEK
jgi:hypothetical protein